MFGFTHRSAAFAAATVVTLAAALPGAPAAQAGAGRSRLPVTARYELPTTGRAGLARARQPVPAFSRWADPPSAQRGLSAATLATTPVAAGPVADALDRATDTIYVASDGPGYNGTGHTVSVIDGRTCRTADLSRCRHGSPTVTVGSNPSGLAVDQATDTIYVTNANSDTVSVIDGATCNAQVRSGCAQTPPQVPVGGTPLAVTLDQANHTAYVVNAAGNDVSMINTATCNAAHLSGCSSQHPATVAVGLGPAGAAVNQVTRTVYVTNDNAAGSPNSNNGTTVSVFSSSTCNAVNQSGCSHQGLITVGTGPIAVTADEGNNTAYTVNLASGTVSVIDGRTCDASDLAGCAAQTPGTVTVGRDPNSSVLDSPAHTLYVTDNGDDIISLVNTNACNGQHRPACSGLVAPAVQAGGEPNGVAVDPATSTLYAPNGIDNNVSVIDTALCDAADTAGCRHPAASVAEHGYLLSLDPATDTLYASSRSLPQIDVISGATCNIEDLTGCAPVATIPMAHPEANIDAGSVDQATHTLYASDPFSDTVSVINIATCNATRTAGCGKAAAVIKVGAFPGPPEINPVSKTLYLPYTLDGTRIAVLNAATCNAEDTTGCGQQPGVVHVPAATGFVAVSPRYDTIYAPSGADNTVSVINGATCDGTDHLGCAQLAATARVGLGPFTIAVNDHTRTLYVTNNAGGNSPGTVSVINAATCDGTRTSGCHQHFPVLSAGRSPTWAAVDTTTNTVYIADNSSAAVTIVNGSRCDADDTSGCGKAAQQRAVGLAPFDLLVSPYARTVYVGDLFQAASMTILSADRP